MKKDNRWCLICNPRNRTLYWHSDDKTGKVWCWCNKCDRAYTLEEYCNQADIDMEEFLSTDFKFEDNQNNEVTAMAWPKNFIPLSDPRATDGINYILSRGLTPDGDMYYDIDEEGIVFPYYYENQFCGAQVRFLKERTNDDGSTWKITTLPGTRLGLLFYGWNQGKFMAQVKGIIVTEGAFNSLAIQQAFNKRYGGVSRSPWRVIACSGSGLSSHQAEALKELKDKGYKIISASDTDDAGFKMYEKLVEHGAVTHYAFCPDVGKDWNDKLKELGHDEFAKFFFNCINQIDVDKE